MGEHPAEQHLRLYAALLTLVLPLPLSEVLPLAGDRTVACTMTVSDDEEGVVVKGVGDDVFIEVIAQVAVEPGADVLVNRLQFDEDKRQSVDEADQIGPAVIARRAKASNFQFAHCDEAVIRFPVRALAVLEINHSGLGMAELALRITVAHRHAVADEFVEYLIVLEQREGEVMPREFAHCLSNGRRRQLRIEPHQRHAQVARQDHLARIGPAHGAVRSEGFVVPGIDAFPSEPLLQMLCKRRLHEPVFAVDVRVGHASALFHALISPLIRRGSRRSRAARAFSICFFNSRVCFNMSYANSWNSSTMVGGGMTISKSRNVDLLISLYVAPLAFPMISSRRLIRFWRRYIL